jgi:hypothetical protein
LGWLPDAPALLVLLERVENGENPFRDVTELFWLFCTNSLSPDEFRDRVLYWINKHLKDEPKGGGFIDRNVKGIIFEGPEKVAQILLNRLDAVSEKNRVPYRPGEADDPIRLYIYTHIEASRLTYFKNSEGYSERTREVLSNALNAFSRCNMAIDDHSNTPLPVEYSISFEAVGSYLYITRFLLQKSESIYEEALDDVLEGISHIQKAQTLISSNVRVVYKTNLLVPYRGMSYDIRKSAPWMHNLTMQRIVDCFEAIRKGSKINDAKRLAEMCESFIGQANESWLYDKRSENHLMPWQEDSEISNNVSTEEFYWDNASDYWQNALGWIEAQLTPSTFKEILNERGEQAADKRLRT